MQLEHLPGTAQAVGLDRRVVSILFIKYRGLRPSSPLPSFINAVVERCQMGQALIYICLIARKHDKIRNFVFLSDKEYDVFRLGIYVGLYGRLYTMRFV